MEVRKLKDASMQDAPPPLTESRLLRRLGGTLQVPRPRLALRHGIVWLLASIPMLIFLVLPILALVLRISPEQLIASGGTRTVVQAIQLSLTTTAITLVLVVVFGTPLAYLLARYNFRGRTAL